ncbi:MAG: hypothetical protein QM762_28295 [Chryseolinea sp.]
MATSFCTGNGNRDPKDGGAQRPSGSHELFSKGKKLGMLKSKKLSEVSGLAASVANPGMLWTLNDSGNPSEVYLIDDKTNIKMTCVLKGINNRDWEEIALGPGPEPGKQYIYVGDIGDNLAQHQYKYIYRFEEPVLRNGEEKVVITNVDEIKFSLSDERRDAEAFFVDPNTLDIYIVGKWKSPCDLYQLKNSASTKEPLVAEHIGTLPMSLVVAANFSDDGSELLIKTYKHVFYFKRGDDMSVVSMLKQKPVELPYEQEPQGESIAWAIGGKGYYTLSEQKKDEEVHLMFYERNAD